MLGVGSQVKIVIVVIVIVFGFVYEIFELGEQVGDWFVGLGWFGEKVGVGVFVVLKVS